MMNKNELNSIFEKYREGALGTSDSDPKKANKWHTEMHKAYKLLRKTPEGRELILSLLNADSPHIRCWAAAHSLEWKPELAKRTLELIRDSEGTCSFDAEMTLREYAKGRLTFDY